MKNEFRVLARELAVEEVATISGAYGDEDRRWEYQTMAIGENGSGCVSPDESWFTVYDQTEAF